MPFPKDVLHLLEDTREVLIETGSGEDATRTVIWVAIHDETVYLRSVRGESGLWYQRAMADPEVTLIVGEFRIEGRAVPADDPSSVEAASRGFQRKYPKSESLESMLRPEVLGTTLRFEPRS